jgi:hypothetical protein
MLLAKVAKASRQRVVKLQWDLQCDTQNNKELMSRSDMNKRNLVS